MIDTGTGVFSSHLKSIKMLVRTKKAIPVVVRAVCRGKLVGEQTVNLSLGDNSLSLPIRDDTAGVVRVTLFDAAMSRTRPLVERLVYRRSDRKLQIEIVNESSARQRSPGEALRLTLQVRDETGEPTEAVLGVSIVDDAVLTLADTPQPKLRTHFLLTGEVQNPEDLEDANFYLEEGDQAAESLDLLLGTQGWRRFVSSPLSQPDTDFRQQLVRLFELDGHEDQATQKTFDNSNRYASRWFRYDKSTRFAWKRLVRESRSLLLAIGMLWLFLILFHLRRHVSMKAGMWLLLASSSVFLSGCGGPEGSVVTEMHASTEAGDPSRNTERGAADLDREPLNQEFLNQEFLNQETGTDDARRPGLDRPVATQSSVSPTLGLGGHAHSGRLNDSSEPARRSVITREDHFETTFSSWLERRIRCGTVTGRTSFSRSAIRSPTSIDS